MINTSASESLYGKQLCYKKSLFHLCGPVCHILLPLIYITFNYLIMKMWRVLNITEHLLFTFLLRASDSRVTCSPHWNLHSTVGGWQNDLRCDSLDTLLRSGPGLLFGRTLAPLSTADSSFLCVAGGSLWVRCCSGGDTLSLPAEEIRGVSWPRSQRAWCVLSKHSVARQKHELQTWANPSGGDPFVSPLPLSRHERGEPSPCVPELQGVLVLAPERIGLGQVNLSELAEFHL